VVTSSTVGKALNSSGFWISTEVIRISTAAVIEVASSRSSRIAGAGTIRSTMMPTMPSAIATSPRAIQPHTVLASGRFEPVRESGILMSAI
jgi:hypothetical protein